MKLINKILIIIGILAIISAALGFFTQLEYLEAARIVFGTPYVLFLPGYVISFLFFKKNKIDIIERIALSFALSIAIVPLLIFYLNLIGMPINTLTSTLTVAGIVVVGLGILKYVKK